MHSAKETRGGGNGIHLPSKSNSLLSYRTFLPMSIPISNQSASSPLFSLKSAANCSPIVVFQRL